MAGRLVPVENGLDRRRRKFQVVVALQLALETLRPVPALAAQAQDKLLALGGDLLLGWPFAAAAVGAQPLLALFLEALPPLLVTLRSVGRETPQRRHVSPASCVCPYIRTQARRVRKACSGSDLHPWSLPQAAQLKVKLAW